MTNADEDMSMAAIELVRGLSRKLAGECFHRGISPEDVALANLYAAVDVAEGIAGRGLAAVEWMRTGLDVIERSLLAGETIQ